MFLRLEIILSVVYNEKKNYFLWKKFEIDEQYYFK